MDLHGRRKVTEEREACTKFTSCNAFSSMLWFVMMQKTNPLVQNPFCKKMKSLMLSVAVARHCVVRAGSPVACASARKLEVVKQPGTKL